jgi:hypothetical protein
MESIYMSVRGMGVGEEAKGICTKAIFIWLLGALLALPFAGKKMILMSSWGASIHHAIMYGPPSRRQIFRLKLAPLGGSYSNLNFAIEWLECCVV